MSFEQSVEANRDPAVPEASDLVRELTTDALLALHRQYGKAWGKFVRVGSLVLGAPSVSALPDRLPLTHVGILWEVFDHPDVALQGRVKAAAAGADRSKSFGDYPGLLDAGHYEFTLGADDSIECVQLEGESGVYGRADNAGREETGRLMQELLGPDIAVQAS